MPTTTRADWKNLPLPQKRTRLDISRTLLASQMERVRQGLLPQSQDDRWFMFADIAFRFLRFDSNCTWRGHFEACHALARELRSQNAGQDELDEFSRQVREVFGGVGSFNDYAPTQFDPVTKRVRPIAGMENLAVASAAVYRAALALTSKADAA